MHAVGFFVDGIATGVADVRIRQRDDLPRVRRIRDDFLVTRDGGIENGFADGLSVRADGNAAEEAAVC